MGQHYHLRCSGCGYRVEDDGLQLQCSRAHSSALLFAEYEEKSFCISPSESGLYRYSSWLPIRRTLGGATSTHTYRSEALCRLTGLDNLWIAFHGYWPERNAYAGTGTFKDLEAYCVLGRLPDLERSVLVVASAGNTAAAAFADACSQHSVQCLIVIPHFGLERFRVPRICPVPLRSSYSPEAPITRTQLRFPRQSRRKQDLFLKAERKMWLAVVDLQLLY